MARVFYVQIRRHGETEVVYEDGPFATREEAEQKLGELDYNDTQPNDPTPPTFTIDERDDG